MLHSSFGFKPYNALMLHCSCGNGTVPCRLLGRKGAVGIPKHCFIEREALKQKYFLNIYVYIYTVHCKQTFGVRINTGQNMVARETRILFLLHTRG